MTQLFSGSFLKTSPERYWLSSVVTGCPAGPPFAAGVRGQETAALGLKGAPPGLGVGEVKDPGWTKEMSGRVPPAVKQGESGGQMGAQ